MKLRIGLVCAAMVLPLTCTSQIPPNVPPPSDAKLSAVVAHVEIPFKLYQDYLIVVRGSLGRFERLNFLIDTGANPTAVDRRIAKKLGLTGDAAKLALVYQHANVERVVLPSLQLGPIRTESVPGVAQDLSAIEKVVGVRIDAIIGFGVLSRSSFVIDYRSKKIFFGLVEPSLRTVPFETGPPNLTVQLRVQDQPVRLLMDTGTKNLLLFECQLPERLRKLPTRDVKRLSNSAESQFEVKELWVPGVRLGVTTIRLEKAFLVSDNANCGRSFDGAIGPMSLGLQWIAFDFEHQRFTWKR
jgi:predicted aspartyl protease